MSILNSPAAVTSRYTYVSCAQENEKERETQVLKFLNCLWLSEVAIKSVCSLTHGRNAALHTGIKKKVKEQAVLRMTELGAIDTPAQGRNFTTQGTIPHHPDWQLLSFPGTLVVLIVWCGESGLGSDDSPDLWVMDKWGGVSLCAGWLRPTGVLRALCWPSLSLW